MAHFSLILAIGGRKEKKKGCKPTFRQAREMRGKKKGENVGGEPGGLISLPSVPSPGQNVR